MNRIELKRHAAAALEGLTARERLIGTLREWKQGRDARQLRGSMPSEQGREFTDGVDLFKSLNTAVGWCVPRYDCETRVLVEQQRALEMTRSYPALFHEDDRYYHLQHGGESHEAGFLSVFEMLEDTLSSQRDRLRSLWKVLRLADLLVVRARWGRFGGEDPLWPRLRLELDRAKQRMQELAEVLSTANDPVILLDPTAGEVREAAKRCRSRSSGHRTKSKVVFPPVGQNGDRTTNDHHR